MFTRAELPASPRYSLSAYLPGSVQRFPSDRVANERLARVYPSTFVRRVVLSGKAGV